MDHQAGNYILASHNSWTYLRPVWWLRPFAWIGRCQRENIICQYVDGARMFDMRVRFGCDGQPYPCHGMMRYDANISVELRVLNDIAYNHDVEIYVRVLLEDDWLSNMDEQARKFTAYCDNLKQWYPSLIFYGGHGVHRYWRNRYYDFGVNIAPVEKHASVCDDSRWYEKIFPWFYAKRRNKQIRGESKAAYLMIDFVDA